MQILLQLLELIQLLLQAEYSLWLFFPLLLDLLEALGFEIYLHQ
jgi:hypothetical protein